MLMAQRAVSMAALNFSCLSVTREVAFFKIGSAGLQFPFWAKAIPCLAEVEGSGAACANPEEAAKDNKTGRKGAQNPSHDLYIKGEHPNGSIAPCQRPLRWGGKLIICTRAQHQSSVYNIQRAEFFLNRPRTYSQEEIMPSLSKFSRRDFMTSVAVA